MATEIETFEIESDAAPTASYDERTVKRFWSHVDRGDDNECWLWHGAKHDSGYGLFGVGGRRGIYVHKFAYLLAHGAVADGKRLVQRCFNRACVNPRHIEAVSMAESRAHNAEYRDRQQRTRPRVEMPPAIVEEKHGVDDALDDVDADEVEGDEPDDEIDEPDDNLLLLEPQPEPDTRPFETALFPDALFEHATFVPDDGYIDEQYNLLNDSVRRYLLANRLDDLGHIACLATVYGHWMKCNPTSGQWFVYHRYAWHAVHERIVCRLVQVVLRLRLRAIRSPESHFAERERMLATRVLVQTHNSVERLVIITRLAQGLVSGEPRVADEFD